MSLLFLRRGTRDELLIQFGIGPMLPVTLMWSILTFDQWDTMTFDQWDKMEY